MKKSSILILYTGGTIGSFEDHKTKSLKPVNFDQLVDFIPELEKVNADITVLPLGKPKDSSNMTPDDWVMIVKAIEENYHTYDGFVVLHGTDTMAYTASAVSFMIENLQKPIIFTGSQLPIGVIRTDGKENLITAIEIASAKHHDGKPYVPEVSIYFEFKLYRANRTYKHSSYQFNAYASPNYPYLAEAGIDIKYNFSEILPYPNYDTLFHYKIESQVVILKLFPGISRQIIENVGAISGLKAIIIETFGFGNGPTQDWFFEKIEKWISQGIVVANVSQCKQGLVDQGKYETSREFKRLGILGAGDMTLEATITKLMFLLANETSDNVHIKFMSNLRGELS